MDVEPRRRLSHRTDRGADGGGRRHAGGVAEADRLCTEFLIAAGDPRDLLWRNDALERAAEGGGDPALDADAGGAESLEDSLELLQGAVDAAVHVLEVVGL